MIVSHITAMSKNRVIGVNNTLPWSLPEDMKFFREKTKGHILIMGRKTFESMPGPLPQRQHIVITRNPLFQDLHPHIFVVSNLSEALKKAQELAPSPDEEVFIIGGGEIYAQSMSITNRIYLTVIDREFQGDTYYPPIDEKQFALIEKKERTHPMPFCFLTYENISSLSPLTKEAP